MGVSRRGPRRRGTLRLPLILALIALPGLVGRQGAGVVHAHEGGTDPHHHDPFVDAFVECVHHVHPHDGDEQGDPVRAGEPGDPVEGPEAPETPDDGERHGHFRDGHTGVLRRTLLADDGAGRRPATALDRAAEPFDRPGEASAGVAREFGDLRGHPPARSGTVIARLVQGIGLRF